MYLIFFLALFLSFHGVFFLLYCEFLLLENYWLSVCVWGGGGTEGLFAVLDG